ncbi:MAG: response regulator transcription factor [Elusimicrobia bacterium]|nr:response regulator transcription factor [Elusimicrobiota bacterium]
MFISIAGDDRKFCSQLQALLVGQDHKVTMLASLEHVVESLQGLVPHLLVVAPEGDSDSAARLLKSIRDDAGLRRLPVLCVNPQGGSAAGVGYLDAGADDFINRPFNGQIFLARVRSLLRRRIWNGDLEEDEVTSLRCGPLVMNLVSRQTLLAGQPVVLTRLGFDLLAFLVRRPNEVFKRELILETVWNYPVDVATRTLDKHVETLRRKLGAFGSAVQTVHGVGYRLEPPRQDLSKTRR